MVSDEAYIQAANEGDPAGFEGLYRRYRDWVYRLAWRMTGDSSDAMDVLQETFIYLLGKFPGFELKAKMTTFLYPTVKHLSLKVIEKKRRHIGGEEVLGAMEDPEPKTSFNGGREALANMVAGLPDKQREVLLLRYVDDLSLEEIAEALSVPVGTVKSRLHGALGKLRESPKMKKYF